MAVKDLYIGQPLQLLLQHHGPAQLVPPVDQVHLLAGAGQIDGVLQGHVPAAHHGHRPAPEERPVAGGAVGHAPSAQPLLAGRAQHGVDGPRGQDHRLRLQLPLIRAYQLMPSPVLQGKGRGFHEFHAQLVRVLPEPRPHVEAVHARHPQVIVHLISIQHLPAAHGVLLQHQQIQPRPLSIYGSRKACRAGTDDDQIIHHVHLLFKISLLPVSSTDYYMPYPTPLQAPPASRIRRVRSPIDFPPAPC